jgi:hypothetical protein
LQEITITATVAPSIYSDTFYNVSSNGILAYPSGSDYSRWLSTSKYYLGYSKWGGVAIESKPELTLDGYDVVALFANFSNTIKVCGNKNNVTEMNIDSITLDSPVSAYTFGSTKGYHIVRYKFKNNEIPDNLLDSCGSVICVKIGENITSIGRMAFRYCGRLKNMEIPDSVKTIKDWAFGECYRLSSLTIGSGLTYIGDSMFANAYDVLKTITITAPKAPQMDGNMFYYVADNGTLYYPRGGDYDSWAQYLREKNWTAIEIS